MKKFLIIIVLAAGFLIAGILFAHSSHQNANNPDCKAAFNECCYKKTTTPSTEVMIWENISREFIAVIPFFH